MHKSIYFVLIFNALFVTCKNNDTQKPSENSVTTESNTKTHDILTDIEKIDELVHSTEATKSNSTDTVVTTSPTSVKNVTESDPATTTPEPVFNRAEAEAEIKTWVEKADCDVSPLGEFKCTMLKKLIKKFFENVDSVESQKLTTRIKNLVKKLEDSDTPLDPEMKKLLKKYKKFL